MPYILLLFLISCSNILLEERYLNSGTLSISQIQNLPGNKILEHAKKSIDVNNVIKTYGDPQELELKQENKENLLIFKYRDRDQIKFKKENLTWIRIQKEQNIKIPEILRKDFIYLIKTGDSFESIAKKFTGDSKNAKRIIYANNNPKLIIGSKIRIPGYLYKAE